MAVKIHYSPSKFAALFGVTDVTPEQTQKLEEWGVCVVVEKTGFSLFHEQTSKTILGNVPLKEGVIGMAKEGNLPTAATEVVQQIIIKAYKHALVWENWTHDDPAGPAKVAAVEIAEEGLTGEWKYQQETLTDHQFKGLGDFFTDAPKGEPEPEQTPAKEPTTEQVTLMKAEALYQPVNGTSASSRYHCVGITEEGIRFAARYEENGTLSVRAEGDVKTYRSQLIGAGFNDSYIDNKGTYTSVHFHGLDNTMANRALGAVLMGTGFNFSTSVPMVSKFVGKGS